MSHNESRSFRGLITKRRLVTSIFIVLFILPVWGADKAKDEETLDTYGFLGYPLLQTADIIIYRASYVPIGVDQAAHLEISRDELPCRLFAAIGD